MSTKTLSDASPDTLGGEVPLSIPAELQDMDIALAPPLQSEGWLSIQLYHQDIVEGFAQYCPDLAYRLLWGIAAEEEMGGIRRRFLRDFGYAREIREQSETRGKNMLVHVLDHSYGHLCGHHRPDMITVHDFHYHVFPEHLDVVRRNTWKRRVARIKEVGHILTITNHLAGEIQEHLGISEDRMSVAYYGIELSRFRKFLPEEVAMFFPKLVEMAEDHTLIANVGTNLERKNMPVLLRAVEELKADGHRPKLLKIGNNLRGDGYGDLIDELGLADEVVELGFLSPDEVAQVFSISHVHAFPSYYEGFGRPTLEAQACELPCVLANASCTPEVGGDGGVYHERDDHGGLAEGVKKIITNHNFKTTLVEAGLENIQRFTWRNHIEGVLAGYAKSVRNS